MEVVKETGVEGGPLVQLLALPFRAVDVLVSPGAPVDEAAVEAETVRAGLSAGISSRGCVKSLSGTSI